MNSEQCFTVNQKTVRILKTHYEILLILNLEDINYEKRCKKCLRHCSARIKRA